MTPVPIGHSSPIHRLVADGRLLAAFLDEDSANAIPEFVRAPLEVQSLARQKFLTAPTAGDQDRRLPVFRHVVEPEVVALLSNVAHECTGPLTLSNLSGFEWVSVDGLLAGHYVAGPMPFSGRAPSFGSAPPDIARFCLLGPSVPIEDVAIYRSAGFFSPEPLRLRMTGFQFSASGVSVQYALDQPPSPIVLLLVDNQAIAVSHQERLVALYEAGISDALCMVYYGYGTEVLKTLPTVTPSRLASSRPPRVVDFSNNSLAVGVPVPTPRSLVTFSHSAVDVAGTPRFR